MAGKIFINYRRDDSAPHALSIAQYMERAFGARNVFIDIDRMRAGQKFPEVLEQRLTECKVMIVIIGPGWLEAHDESGAHRLKDPDDWVRLEVGRALARDVTVIPVTVGGAHLPKRGDLPEDLRALVDHHAVAITTNGFRSEMAGLRDDIRSIRAGFRMSWRIGAGAAAAAVVATGLWSANHWMGPFFPEKPRVPTLASVVERPPQTPALLTTPQVDQGAQRQDEEAKRTVERTQRIEASTDRAGLPQTPAKPTTPPVDHGAQRQDEEAKRKATQRIEASTDRAGLPQTPAKPTTAPVDHGAQRQDEEAKRKADLTQRIAVATDRSELLALMQRETADRPAITSRLETLGYAQVATATAGDKWLRAGGGRDTAETFKDCGANETWCPTMVVAPPGRFMMGSPKGEPGRSDDEDDGNKNQVPVAMLSPFAVSKFAVTFDQWDACVAGGGCNAYRPDDNKWGRGRLPVINVSWDDAQGYVKWLSRKTGKDYRLLSEAEREYVARAGTQTPFWWGSSISSSQANYDGRFPYGGGSAGEFRAKTVAVDSFAANPWGLYQVDGNVWEWVDDCYHMNYAGMQGAASASDSTSWGTACETSSDGKDTLRVLRGGSWFNLPQVIRSAIRRWDRPGYRGDDAGFRVARAL